MYSPNRLANTYSGERLSSLFFTNPNLINSSKAQQTAKDLKSQIVLRSTSFQKSLISSTYEKITWDNTKAILRVGEEYSKKIIESEAKKAEKLQKKKNEIIKKNEIVEKIKAEENERLALKISKLNEEFYNKVKKLEKEAMWKVAQNKNELVMEIERSKNEMFLSVNEKSNELINQIFPGKPVVHPVSCKSGFSIKLKPGSPTLATQTQAKIAKSLEALSKTQPQVQAIKSKLVKNI